MHSREAQRSGKRRHSLVRTQPPNAGAAIHHPHPKEMEAPLPWVGVGHTMTPVAQPIELDPGFV
jgi:hypothetical protein